jgi:hypothetical protein
MLPYVSRGGIEDLEGLDTVSGLNAYGSFLPFEDGMTNGAHLEMEMGFIDPHYELGGPFQQVWSFRCIRRLAHSIYSSISAWNPSKPWMLPRLSIHMQIGHFRLRFLAFLRVIHSTYRLGSPPGPPLLRTQNVTFPLPKRPDRSTT